MSHGVLQYLYKYKESIIFSITWFIVPQMFIWYRIAFNRSHQHSIHYSVLSSLLLNLWSHKHSSINRVLYNNFRSFVILYQYNESHQRLCYVWFLSSMIICCSNLYRINQQWQSVGTYYQHQWWWFVDIFVLSKFF